MVYHSQFNEGNNAQVVCSTPLLPFRKDPLAEDRSNQDIVDEALYYYRANVLFKNFEFKGPADKLTAYITVYVTTCLNRLNGVTSKAEGARKLAGLAAENFAIPGDSHFVMAGFFDKPRSPSDSEAWKTYVKQLRERVGERLLERVFENGERSKWWMSFAKKKFMNLSM